MSFRWFDLSLNRYLVSGIFIGLVMVALVNAWLQS